jgi:hypothetical protein
MNSSNTASTRLTAPRPQALVGITPFHFLQLWLRILMYAPVDHGMTSNGMNSFNTLSALPTALRPKVLVGNIPSHLLSRVYGHSSVRQ